jgi:hypothetical protein
MRALMIEARWATYIAQDLRRAGHALDGPLKEVGLARTDVASPEGRIPYAAYMGLIERAALLLDEPGYGLKLGATHDVRDSGLVGFIALNSPTLRDALANVGRYIDVTNEGLDVSFDCHGSGGGVLRFREADPPMRGLRHHAEQSMALILRGARELTRKRAVPLRVEFTHARPNAGIDYEAILGCPVRFQAEWDAVVFPEEALRMPVIGADNRLLRVLEAACRRIVGRRPAKGDLVHGVREYVVQRLKNGTPASTTSPAISTWLQDTRAPACQAQRQLSRPGRLDPLRPCQALPGEHRPAAAPDRLCAGLFRAGTTGARLQAVDRHDANPVSRTASMTPRCPDRGTMAFCSGEHHAKHRQDDVPPGPGAAARPRRVTTYAFPDCATARAP